jgi:hypothetical protein
VFLTDGAVRDETRLFAIIARHLGELSSRAASCTVQVYRLHGNPSGPPPRPVASAGAAT